MDEIYPKDSLVGCCETGMLQVSKMHNPTVGENLELRIKVLKEELARLEASRYTLQPLMNMRIRDIRDAMDY